MELSEAIKRAGEIRARLIQAAEYRGYMAIMSCERVYPAERVKKEATIAGACALDAYALDCLIAAAAAIGEFRNGVSAGAAAPQGLSQLARPEFLSNVDPGDESDRSPYDLYARIGAAQ